MKKIFFIAATVLGIANLSAQEKTLSSQFGIKSAANMSSYNGKDVENADYGVGLTAGIYGNFPLTESFSIQPEVNFSRMRGKLTKDEYEYNTDGSTLSKSKDFTTLDYIQVPVMFKYYVAGSRLSLEAGPQVGYLIYASNKYVESTFANGTVFNEGYAREDVKDNFEKFDFGVNYGIGYNLSDHVNISARYYMGLTKAYKYEEDGVEKNANVKNNSFSFGVGYSF